MRNSWHSSWQSRMAESNQGAQMRAAFSFIGTTVLGSVGWAIGAYIGIGTAIVLSCIGSGFGMYWGRRLFDQWLG